MRKLLNCARCGVNLYDPRKRALMYYCVPCRTDRDRAQKKAKDALKYAIKRGRMKHPTAFPCADCGQPATQYEHRDYDKPLDVRPVCQPCNYKSGPANWYI